jgi:uncharacterized protein (DUF1501 family)
MPDLMTRRKLLRPMWLGGRQDPLPQYRPRVSIRATGAPGDILICVFLRGGTDGLSLVPPYFEGADYYDGRPTIAIPEPGAGPFTAIDLDGSFGFHPGLAPLKPFYDAGSLAVVHGAGLVEANRSHFDAQRYFEQGVPNDKTIGTGWLGRHLSSTGPGSGSVFRGIALSDHVQAALRGELPALAVSSLENIGFHGPKNKDDEDLALALLQQFYLGQPVGLLHDQAQLLFETIAILRQLAEAGYTPAAGAVYPDDGFGYGLRQIAQLVKADLGLEAACIDLGGWDTHETQGVRDGQFAGLAASLGAGLAAFATDLGDRMQNVTIVTMSEFGRTTRENGSAGTDHGHGNAMLLLGGGVIGGHVYSRWPGMSEGELDSEGDLVVTIDYRDVFAEILQYRLLNPALSQVLPNFVPTPLGALRPRV